VYVINITKLWKQWWDVSNNHHWVLLTYRNIYEWKEHCVTPWHDMEGTYIQKRVEFMWHIFYGIESMISWLGKRKEGMCNANSFKKTIGSTNTGKNPQWNNYYVSMQIPTTNLIVHKINCNMIACYSKHVAS
jgi:hypothetical protein